MVREGGGGKIGRGLHTTPSLHFRPICAPICAPIYAPFAAKSHWEALYSDDFHWQPWIFFKEKDGGRRAMARASCTTKEH